MGRLQRFVDVDHIAGPHPVRSDLVWLSLFDQFAEAGTDVIFRHAFAASFLVRRIVGCEIADLVIEDAKLRALLKQTMRLMGVVCCHEVAVEPVRLADLNGPLSGGRVLYRRMAALHFLDEGRRAVALRLRRLASLPFGGAQAIGIRQRLARQGSAKVAARQAEIRSCEDLLGILLADYALQFRGLDALETRHLQAGQMERQCE
ncbi:hypothetical protein [Mesorhizobium sp. J428]|uniref:hypothetical protein n=1 Tax=Mesorhizobium sp. J428 TaxID=2898440 RepID=UPI002150F3D2|nr:hypothetical protein [Mesorhizobium sp. J428]MCR5860202.1 hypothetical protein [Mesorhizobium sp. J428]